MAELVREIMIDATPETIWPFLVDPSKHVEWLGTTADIDCADGKSLNVGGSNNTIVNSRGYAIALWWDNGFFGPHPSQKGPSQSPIYNPVEQNLTIDGDNFAGGGKFLYGVPWRAGAKKSATLEDFVKATGYERSGKISNQSISPPGIDERMKSYFPFSEER